jgi:uncharacterized protein (UPF0276 family)
MSSIRSSIACNLDANILLASIPLFESEKVQAIEWAFDTVFKHEQIPEWFAELLCAFGNEGRLIGHGVFFSLFSGKWTKEQQEWLDRLKTLAATHSFDHISEHFGFMTGADFHKGAPMSVPFTPSTLALGRDRLQRIQQACNCPVGLENLAFAYSTEEVKRHGDFLDQLLGSVNGFIILDLHNLYCQMQNFDLGLDEVLALYPLDRVREMHISGGSWRGSQTQPPRMIRRDTHDDAVPDEVFGMLERTISRCPNLKYAVLEQLGSGLDTEEQRNAFRQDFLTMDRIVEQQNGNLTPMPIQSFLPPESCLPGPVPLEDSSLHAQQLLLSNILETATDYRHAQQLLRDSDLSRSGWQIEQWEPCMLETAMDIARKWNKVF